MKTIDIWSNMRNTMNELCFVYLSVFHDRLFLGNGDYEEVSMVC